MTVHECNGFHPALILCRPLAAVLLMPLAAPPMPVLIRFVRPARSLICGGRLLTVLRPVSGPVFGPVFGPVPWLLLRLIMVPSGGTAIGDGKRYPDQLFDIAKERNLLPVTERDGDTFRAGARGAADAM